MSNSRTVPTTTSPSACTFKIVSEGTVLSHSYHILAITVTTEINKIQKASIILLDGDAASETFEISDKDELILNKNIEIMAGYNGTEDTIFKGVIIKHGIKIKRGSTYLHIECRDKSYLATLEKKNNYFEEVKDSEIIEDILGIYGLEKDVDPTQDKHESIVQFDTSDWDLILRRTLENGLFAWSENGKVFAKKPVFNEEVNLNLIFGATILELDAEIDARIQPKIIKAQSWDYTYQALTIVDAKEPSMALNGNISASDLAKTNTTINFSQKISEPILQKIVDDELLKHRLSKIRGRVKCQGNIEAKIGKIMHIEGIGNRFKGKAYISAIRHHIASGNWETDIQLGYPESIFFNKTAPHPFNSNGLHIGVVTQLTEDPKGEHRIKVKMPTISTLQEGIWARVASLDAGENRGMFFRPEIGDEVVLGFFQNDINHPIVLGMCNSSAKPAPIEAKDENHIKGYVSRSQMKMLFDDEKKIVTIETETGNKMIFSEEDNGIFLEDQNGNKITLNQDGILIESPKEIKIKALKDIKIEGLKVEAKASAGFKADGGGGCELSAGNGITAVKGGTVMLN